MGIFVSTPLLLMPQSTFLFAKWRQFGADDYLPRFMPPTIPAGTPCVAVVWARLKVGSDDRGIRPFIVSLNDGYNMCPGVIAKYAYILPVDRTCVPTPSFQAAAIP
jgi:hypothetical protein